MGRAYTRPTTGTAKRPRKNAFGTPRVGACFKRCLPVKFGGFVVDSSRSDAKSLWFMSL
jgi:hypothetical protein